MEFTATFCTYFKRIERFKYEHETYTEYTAFCVKSGSFRYRIGEGKENIAREGEIVFCPPEQKFYREVIDPIELCMIKFLDKNDFFLRIEKIKIAALFRFFEDLEKLEGCLYCYTLQQETRFLHYCLDILYLAKDGFEHNSRLRDVKEYIEQNYNKDFRVSDLAKGVGFTTPYLICLFKAYYAVTPKAYQSKIKIMKAKELLLGTEMLSREIAYQIGFLDELYFIRFFKKYTGVTPMQFRKTKIL